MEVKSYLYTALLPRFPGLVITLPPNEYIALPTCETALLLIMLVLGILAVMEHCDTPPIPMALVGIPSSTSTAGVDKTPKMAGNDENQIKKDTVVTAIH